MLGEFLDHARIGHAVEWTLEGFYVSNIHFGGILADLFRLHFFKLRFFVEVSYDTRF